MEDELAIIFPGIIMILVILGLTINGIVKKVLDYKREQTQSFNQDKSDSVAQIAERAQMIEDRVRVLERLATDRGTLLSDEIEALRGETPTKSSTQAMERG